MLALLCLVSHSAGHVGPDGDHQQCRQDFQCDRLEGACQLPHACHSQERHTVDRNSLLCLFSILSFFVVVVVYHFCMQCHLSLNQNNAPQHPLQYFIYLKPFHTNRLKWRLFLFLFPCSLAGPLAQNTWSSTCRLSCRTPCTLVPLPCRQVHDWLSHG